MPRKKVEGVAERQPQLTIPRSEAHTRIAEQINKGLDIRNLPIRSHAELDAAGAQKDKWDSYNKELLSRIFDTPAISEEYSRSGGFFVPGGADLSWWIDDFRQGVTQKMNRLEGIAGRLDLIPAPGEKSAQSSASDPSVSAPEIFIVHGHDEAAKESVARFLERVGLRPVILHEQPNRGMTVIEKFEGHANVIFAVVLLTPDDVGASRARPDEQQPRARQNVVFELGYFVGKLGRSRVCALYKEGLETPVGF